MKTKDKKAESRIKRWLKAPIRGLLRARDLYVTSMINLARRLSHVEGVYGCPTTDVTTLPKSFSYNSITHDDDFNELVKVASTKCLEDRIDLDFQAVGATKSNSGVVRIGKEHSFDVCNNKVVNLKTADLFPRNRSYVVVSKTDI